MFGLLFSSIGTVVQGGFVIGVGILLDTFLVRTITVPAIAALVGRANWWPSQPWLPEAADDAAPEKKTVFDAVTENRCDVRERRVREASHGGSALRAR